MAKKSLIIAVIILAVIVAGATLYLTSITKISPEGEEMKYCVTADDCVPVGCSCNCSGCGGFSYEDVVNKEYKEMWYSQHNCAKPTICLMVCCPQRRVACENNICVVKRKLWFLWIVE